MRTTLELDDDVMDAVRSLARAQHRSMGTVLSDLARRGLNAERRLADGAGGFPTFDHPPDVGTLTLETVRDALDDE